MENEIDHCSSLNHLGGRLSFHDSVADGLVFHFAGFVYGHVRSLAVCDATFLAVDVGCGQSTKGSGDLWRIEAGIVDARVVDRG